MPVIKECSQPGNADRPNEDWSSASPDLLLVLDGATVRTDTGCVHGLVWFVDQLAASLLRGLADPSHDMAAVLESAIDEVARLHPQCDLNHPGTPSAAVGIVRFTGDALQYLVLGDITVVIDTDDGLIVQVDTRVSQTGKPFRQQAKSLPFGHPDRPELMIAMKRGELAARNVEGGYWIASTVPDAAKHSLTGELTRDSVRRVAVLSDGAARYVALFGLGDWTAALDRMAADGPSALIADVRDVELADADGLRWPRMKRSDDATAIYWEAEGR